MEFKLFDSNRRFEEGIGCIEAKSRYLYDRLEEVYNKIKFSEIEDEIFKKMVIARIIEPRSKKGSIKILKQEG